MKRHQSDRWANAIKRLNGPRPVLFCSSHSNAICVLSRDRERRPIRYTCCHSNTIADVLEARGWQSVGWQTGAYVEISRRQHRTSNVLTIFMHSSLVIARLRTDWDLGWMDIAWIRESMDKTHLHEHQRVNHFRNHFELTKKNLMFKNIKRHRRLVERDDGKEAAVEFDIIPTTFELPAEYAMFVEEFKRCPSTPWIMKPVGSSQGKGIFLINKLSQIQEWKRDSRFSGPSSTAATTTAGAVTSPDTPPVQPNYIVQRYIPHPYLIGGKKFDLRVYVLVLSFTPLTVWIHRCGFARFTGTPYSADLSQLDNVYMHLTNNAIQKTSADYNAEGAKWSLHQLRLYLMARHGHKRTVEVFNAMQDTIVASLKSVQRVIISDKHCFELYGFDLLLDSKLKCWLIEVNSSPSLSASSATDYALKFGLLDDTLRVIDMEGRYAHSRTTHSHSQSDSACDLEPTRIGCFDRMCFAEDKSIIGDSMMGLKEHRPDDGDVLQFDRAKIQRKFAQVTSETTNGERAKEQETRRTTGGACETTEPNE